MRSYGIVKANAVNHPRTPADPLPADLRNGLIKIHVIFRSVLFDGVLEVLSAGARNRVWAAADVFVELDAHRTRRVRRRVLSRYT